MAEYWMRAASERMEKKGTRGALTSAAKRAGMSISEYCAKRGKRGKTAKRCAFAKAARTVAKRHRRRRSSR